MATSTKTEDLTMYTTELGLIVRQFAPLQATRWETVPSDSKHMLVSYMQVRVPFVNSVFWFTHFWIVLISFFEVFISVPYLVQEFQHSVIMFSTLIPNILSKMGFHPSLGIYTAHTVPLFLILVYTS